MPLLQALGRKLVHSGRQKMESHAVHLLKGIVALKERYAILDPMLFDASVISMFKGTPAMRGFIILRNSLFLSCAQDVAKLATDSDGRAPSISKLMASLDSELRDQWKESYSEAHTVWEEEDSCPEFIARSHELDAQETKEREAEFDTNYEQLIELWNAFSDSSELDAFRNIRDKVTAHTELRVKDGEYKPLDIADLGLNWGALKASIETMTQIVEEIRQLICRETYAWAMLDEMLSEAAISFWQSSGVAH